MTPQYQPENYLDYQRHLDIYNQSNFFTHNQGRLENLRAWDKNKKGPFYI